jgi:hypothetical protein
VETTAKEELRRKNDMLRKKLRRMTDAVMGWYTANHRIRLWKRVLLAVTCKFFIKTRQMRTQCVSLLSAMSSMMYVLHEDQLQNEVRLLKNRIKIS